MAENKLGKLKKNSNISKSSGHNKGKTTKKIQIQK
jgi:hypothetical protein